jgi:hypothetical protein
LKPNVILLIDWVTIVEVIAGPFMKPISMASEDI